MQRLLEIIPFLHGMKGARLSVLIACWCSTRGLTNAELQNWTDYNQDTVRHAVQYLVENGWLEAKNFEGRLRLRDDAALPFPEVAFGGVPRDEGARGSLPRERNPRQPVPAPASAPTRVLSRAQQKHEKLKQEWDHWLLEQTADERERAVKSLEALNRRGIQVPKAWELARLPHINPVYIRQHVEAALRDGYPLGTAIDRMYKCWEPPRPVDYETLNASGGLTPEK